MLQWRGISCSSIHWLAIFIHLTNTFHCSGLVAPPNTFIPKVLYESNRILAIEKDPGISHHNDESTGELGIVSRLQLHYQNEEESIDGWDGRLYGVHRLDQVTSGILLLAKDSEMAGILSAAFRRNLITKYYVGVSNRKPKKKKQGWVKGNMVRGRRKSWYLTREDVTHNNDNDPSSNNNNYAVTRFFTAGLGEINQRLLNDNSAQGMVPMTCLLFHPKTGKTHQLRVAAKSVGLPLLGDPVYGDPCTDYRTFLHASAIHVPLDDPEFADCGHEPVTIWCPPPFADLLREEEAHELFDQTLNKLFQKFCDCPEILSVIENQRKITER